MMLRTEPTAEDSLALILARSRFGIAIAAMIKMIATTINNSINEKPFCLRIRFFPLLGSLRPEIRNRIYSGLSNRAMPIMFAFGSPSSPDYKNSRFGPHCLNIFNYLICPALLMPVFLYMGFSSHFVIGSDRYCNLSHRTYRNVPEHTGRLTNIQHHALQTEFSK